MPFHFTKAFSKFDIFGSEVGLNYQKDNVFKTTFGGLISLSFITFICLFFWSNIMSFISRGTLTRIYFIQEISYYVKSDAKLKNVTASTTKMYYENPPNSLLDSKGFMFAVRIDDENFLTRPMFNVTMETRDYVTFSNGTKKKQKYPVQLEPCTLDHWKNLPSQGTNWTDVYYKNHYKGFLCPRLQDKFLIGGSFYSEHFFHWKFSITKCVNNVPKNDIWQPTCASDAEIDKFFSKNTNVRFEIMINNFVLNPLNSNDYVNSFAEDSIFFSIQRQGAYQTADIYLTENIVLTDNSILPFQDVKEERFLLHQYGNFRQQYQIGQIDKVYAEFYFRKDSFSYITTRSYQKISEIISYIGGFAQIFIMISAIIVHYYNEYIYAISLANKIYDFDYGNYRKNDKEKVILPNEPSLQNINNIQENKNDQKITSTFDNQTQAIFPICNIELQKTKNKSEVQSVEQGISQDLTNSLKKKKKRVTTRQDDGLIPLNMLKSILSQRKTYIEQTMIKSQFKTQEDKQFSIENCHLEDKGNQSQQQHSSYQEVQGENNQNNWLTKSIDVQIEESMQNQNKKKKNNGLIIFTNVQTNLEQVQSKNVINESVLPETPFKIQQSPQKQIHSQNEKQNKEKHVKINTFLFVDQNNSYNSQKEENKEMTQLEKQGQEQVNKEYDNIDQSQSQKNISEQVEPLSLENIQINSNQALFENQNQQEVGQLIKMEQVPNTPNYQKQLQNKQEDLLQEEINKELLQGLGFKSKKQFLKKEFDYLLRKDTAIKMTYKYFLYKLTCGKFFKTEQVLLLHKVFTQMKNDLDIFMIINKLKELEKIKKLFLDKNQEILFNFFPKPVLSVKEEKDQQLSRAQMTEQAKSRNVQIQQNTQMNKKKLDKYQNNLNLNFKTAALVSKAAYHFKKPLTDKINGFNNLNAYQRLYDSYQELKKQGESTFNKRLIEQLGEEMNNIFEISNMQIPQIQFIIQILQYKTTYRIAIKQGSQFKQRLQIGTFQQINWDSNVSLTDKQIEQNKKHSTFKK